MNKQEAIEKIKNLEGLTVLDKTINFDNEMIPKKEVFDIINQIDEQEKTVVPKFVADWYEECKDYFDFNIYGFYKYFYSQSKHEEVKKWLDNAENKAIETLVKMKLYGYEVEREKMYKVSLKRNGIGIGIKQQDGSVKDKLTKTELSEYGFNGLDVYEVKEVEE